MIETVILILIHALRIIPKGLMKGLENFEFRVEEETIQKTATLRSAKILRRVLKTCFISNSSELTLVWKTFWKLEKIIIGNVLKKICEKKWQIWTIDGIKQPSQRIIVNLGEKKNKRIK